MLIKQWKLNISYKKGDIIYIGDKCYACTLEHISDNLINPVHIEEIHWVYLKQLNFLGTDATDTLKETPIKKPILTVKEKQLKRKLNDINNELDVFKKKRKITDSELCFEDQIKLLNVNLETKLFLTDKYNSFKDSGSSDYAKGKAWLNTVLNIPFGKFKDFPITNSDSVDKVKKYFKKVREHLDLKVHNLDNVKDEIMEYLARKITNPDSKGHILALCGPPGCGKCFSKDTPILMFNGAIKMVQDITPGELLMGDDSTPRTVLALGRGRDIMYKITNMKGENYTVNSEHILCLKYPTDKFIKNDKKYKRFIVKWFNNSDIKINNKNFYYKNNDKVLILEKAKQFMNNLYEEKICEVSVKNYLKLSNSIKGKLKGYSTSVNFNERQLDFDPYVLGLWLSRFNPQCLQQHKDLTLNFIENHLKQYNYFDKIKFKIFVDKVNDNWHRDIPDDYKCNSRHNRLKLLAGLIDSNFNYNKSVYQLSQPLENEKVIDDIIYLCRSLGFSCYKNKCERTCKISISGQGIEEIPVLCRTNKVNLRGQVKNVLVSSINVEELSEDNYYGFMIDGNERFVLGNFIVTHNTKILKTLGEALNLPFYQINFGGLNDASILTGHSETYIGSKPGKIVEFLQKSGCMNPVIYCDEIDKIASNKEREINGILTHILDEEQNDKFQDNYLSNIPIDLSKVFFVIAFNDFEKVDRIVSDRLKVIYVSSLSIEDKVKICKEKVIPDIMKSFNFKKNKYICLNDDLISYIVNNKIPKEEGIRQLRKSLEKVFSKLNYYILTDEHNTKVEYFKIDIINKIQNINIRRKFVDVCLNKTDKEDNISHMMMYV